MQNQHVHSFTENCWCDVIDYSSLLDDDGAPPPAFVSERPPPPSEIVCMSIDATHSEVTTLEERGSSRKRGRSDQNGGIGAKACRERERRGKLNERFLELSAILGRERPFKTEKLAMLSDAIRLLNQLKTESMDYMEMNTRLLEEIKILKAEKNELREEKAKLKADKERIQQQLETMNIPSIGFTASHPPMYEAEVKKVPMLPSYGFVPMWQYLPPSVRDTTIDHELRPPAA
ncbi:transcription factor bHLH104-like [Salvia miltiorrhiza]|uniref:transcription factor bHLH104-like n=1 Tax=Salvia miltiorrhiza TaxID=226208 RepID=UPI0025ACA933|nr:transcription factor bHLH104-like [Salvia miltiorrhiza]